MTALAASQIVLAACLLGEHNNEGIIEVNMLDAIAAIQMQELSVHAVGGKEQMCSAEPHAHVYIRAPYGAFKTSDGYIVIAHPSRKKLGEIIGEESFLETDDENEVRKLAAGAVAASGT